MHLECAISGSAPRPTLRPRESQSDPLDNLLVSWCVTERIREPERHEVRQIGVRYVVSCRATIKVRQQRQSG